jgi:hypothetical protein
MTSEKFYSILKYIDDLDRQLGLQKSLESVRDALSNLVGSPAQPQYQSALASALESFASAAAKLGEAITPSQASVIAQMGGGDFFDAEIAAKVRSSIQLNAMTPSVARDFVQELATKRSSFLAQVKGARQNLEALGVKESELRPGGADIAFLIPRGIFKNQLGDFAKELNFISRLMQHYSEAVTTDTRPIELEQLSSSIPTVALLADATVIGVIATVVTKFLGAWEKIEKIRKLRAEIAEMGLKGAAVDELTESVTTTVDEVVEESTQIVVAKYKGDAARKSELENGIRQETRRLFGQIERGLTIEFRARPEKGQGGEVQEALQNISDLGKGIEFPEVAKEPLLIESGQVIEGELQASKHSKKTTRTTTTSAKKETTRESKD